MKNFLLILIIILPVQLLIPSFTWQIVLLIAAGLILAFVRPLNYVFMKAFFVTAVISLILYMMYANENHFMNSIFANIGLPAILAPVAFILINSLTAGFSFQVGQSIKNIVK